MQSLIHGNFEGAAQKKVYALVGASAAIAAAVGPLLGGFITTYLSWRVGFALEVVVIAVVLSRHQAGQGRAVHRDRAQWTSSARCCRSSGMGGIVLGILVWQEGGESVGAADRGRRARRSSALVCWLVRRKRAGKPALIDPDLFDSKLFRSGSSRQMLQQIALGGTMIALPIFLQMVLEYNAMQAGLSLAPLSLSMFAVALLAGQAGRRAGARAAIIRAGLRAPTRSGIVAAHPDRPARDVGLVPRASR